MKNLKLTIFSAILLALTALTSCTKEDTPTPVVPPVTPPALTANAVYYRDSAKIYSTSLTGTDRKLVVGIDTTSPNSYIGTIVRSNDGNKLYFLHYTSGSTSAIKLYSVNKDGTGLTMLKNLPSGGPEYVLLKATADNKIVFYQVAVTPPSTVVTSLQTINTDGTNQTTLASLPTGSPFITSLSLAVNRYMAFNFTGSGTLQTGTISGSTIGAPVTVSSSLGLKPNASILSNDGTKITYAIINAASKIEIYIYDVATAATQLKFTHTVVSTVPSIASSSISLRWVAGTDKILLGYGKYTSPSGSASDFTQLTLYTLSNSAEVTWRFEGDDIYNVVTE